MSIESTGFGIEIKITATMAKTRARVFEVPISYYGRTYEEGKKIGMWDGVYAVWALFYFNLIAAWSPKRNAFVKSINEWLGTANVREPLTARVPVVTGTNGLAPIMKRIESKKEL
jgi:hypothetical protein